MLTEVPAQWETIRLLFFPSIMLAGTRGFRINSAFDIKRLGKIHLLSPRSLTKLTTCVGHIAVGEGGKPSGNYECEIKRQGPTF